MCGDIKNLTVSMFDFLKNIVRNCSPVTSVSSQSLFTLGLIDTDLIPDWVNTFVKVFKVILWVYLKWLQKQLHKRFLQYNQQYIIVFHSVVLTGNVSQKIFFFEFSARKLSASTEELSTPFEKWLLCNWLGHLATKKHTGLICYSGICLLLAVCFSLDSILYL